ncbi:MAG: hypothetical protein D6744_12340, partial [Planctomycetota bacterium]
MKAFSSIKDHTMNQAIRATACVAAIIVAPITALSEPTFTDSCETLDGWSVHPSAGVTAQLRLDAGADGKSLRLDFDFTKGSGFVVLRRDLSIELPENYRFRYELRGSAPPNNLEFKLVSESGEDVWWVNRRAFHFPREWRAQFHKRRHFTFAWGPSGGKPLKRIGAIEFAVAAAEGGRGTIWIDNLAFEPLPVPQPVIHDPRVHVSSVDQTSDPALRADDAYELPASGEITWHSARDDDDPTLTLDFQQVREFGGLVIDWDPTDFATDYIVETSVDGDVWRTDASITCGGGGRDWVPMRDAQAAFVRVRINRTSRGRGVGLKRLSVLDVSFADSPNAMYSTIARESPRGWFPRTLLGEAQPWTVVGADRDADEALIDAAGAVEVDRGNIRIEPFLFVGGRLRTWADARCEASLADDGLPLPFVTWRCDDLRLTVEALADDRTGGAVLLTRYTVTNARDTAARGSLLITLRPFQVLPPWQDLSITGGVCDVSEIRRQNHG